VRRHAVAGVLPRLLGTDRGRAFLFSTLSQTRVSYRGGPLSEGRAGAVHAGDRLPWFSQTGDGEGDNFTPLRSRWWQVHVYGEPKAGFAEVRAACDRRGIPVVQLPWRAAAATVGLESGALYLVRPDGYLAYVDSEARPNPLDEYLSRVEIWTRT
jgi:hypothetical protein